MTIDFPHEQWFSGYGFDGYGTIAVVRQAQQPCLALEPMKSTAPGETHAALVTSKRSYADFDATFADVVTVEQLRAGSAPNPWERAWMLWHVVDACHFYYVILKANGWELGKRDPAYPGGQRFLATGQRPSFPVGVSNTLRIMQRGNRLSVAVDGEALVTFADRGEPDVPASCGAYLTGRFGFYCEDARVRFGGFTLHPNGEPASEPFPPALATEDP